MPWDVVRDSRCPKSKPFGVVKESGELVACHPTKTAAQAQRRALYASEEKAMNEPETELKSWEPVPFTVTSFAALTAARKEMETAEHVADLAEDLKAMTANIFANPEVTDKAGALRALADEFAALVAQPAAEEKGIEGTGSWQHPAAIGSLQFASPQHAQLYAEVDRLIALIIGASEPERSVLRQKLADLLATGIAKEAVAEDPARAALVDKCLTCDADKATWDAAYVNDLPDSAFLFVEPGDKQDGKTTPRSKRHFPYKDAAGKVDVAHTRNAIARIPQSNAPGLTAEKKTALQERARKILADAQKERGFWSRITDAVKGWLSAEEPAPQPAFTLWKENGTYRWLATYSNKYRDRDKPPEILSEAAHLDFVKAVDAGEWPAPELWLWHVPGTRIGVADWVTYADGFALASGTIDKAQAATAEQLERMPDPLAVSHGMPVKEIQRDADDDTVITRYRTREISVLPDWAAANALTGFDIQEVKDMAIPQDKKEFLLAAGLSEDRITAIEAELEGKAKSAADAGLEFKQAEPTAETVVTQPPVDQKDETQTDVVPEPAPPAPAPVAALTAEDIATAVRDVLKPIEERLTNLESLKEQIGALNKTQDERVAEQLAATPAASLTDLLRGAMGYERAIGNKEARIDGRSALAKSGPEETEPSADATQFTAIPWVNHMLTETRRQ